MLLEKRERVSQFVLVFCVEIKSCHLDGRSRRVCQPTWEPRSCAIVNVVTLMQLVPPYQLPAGRVGCPGFACAGVLSPGQRVFEAWMEFGQGNSSLH